MHSAHLLTSLNKPTSREYESVENWMNNEKPVAERDASFIYCKEDLITLRPGREKAWLETVIEKVLHLLRWEVRSTVEAQRLLIRIN